MIELIDSMMAGSADMHSGRSQCDQEDAHTSEARRPARAAALAVARDRGCALVSGHARGCGGAAGPGGMQLRWRMDGRSPIKLRLHVPGGKKYAQTAAFG